MYLFSCTKTVWVLKILLNLVGEDLIIPVFETKFECIHKSGPLVPFKFYKQGKIAQAGLSILVSIASVCLTVKSNVEKHLSSKAAALYKEEDFSTA